jgi:hypothetical protein
VDDARLGGVDFEVLRVSCDSRQARHASTAIGNTRNFEIYGSSHVGKCIIHSPIVITYAIVSIRFFVLFSFLRSTESASVREKAPSLSPPEQGAKVNEKCKSTYPWASQLGGRFICHFLRHVSIEDDFLYLFVVATNTEFTSFLNFFSFFCLFRSVQQL